MRKVLIIILTIVVIFTSGCTKFNDKPDSTIKGVDASNSADNSFFYKSNSTQMSYKGKFLFDDDVEKTVKLNINKLAGLKNGNLYELRLAPIEGIPNDRLSLGCFYVQKDKIYKIEPTEESLSKLKTSEELPDGSVIVCQDKKIKDTLGKDELGFHNYMVINGDKREYHSYNNQVDTGYYEAFTWEKGKGLINYRSGYGAERDSIELQLINN